MSYNSSRNSLYITLQYLRVEHGQNKYHWALYLTDKDPPAGHLIHATDQQTGPLQLYREIRGVRNPMRSKSMVVCLKIANSPGLRPIEQCSSQIQLMNPRYLPRNEPRWTCRVWLKELLNLLHNSRLIQLPMGIDQIERICQAQADAHIHSMGQAVVYNDLNWLSISVPTRLPNNAQSHSGARAPYYGPKPMDVDPTAYYGPKPMITETHRNYGPNPMVTQAHRNYGSKPMVTETHRSFRF